MNTSGGDEARKAVDSNELFIEGLEVPDGDVVGEVGRGFLHLIDSLNPERIAVNVARSLSKMRTLFGSKPAMPASGDRRKS